jgi:hypothetical protein
VRSKVLKEPVSSCRSPFVLDSRVFQGQIDFLPCHLEEISLDHLELRKVLENLFYQAYGVEDRLNL